MKSHPSSFVRHLLVAGALLLLALASASAFGQDRFPRPEFETAYEMPVTDQPQPGSAVWNAVDVGALFAVLIIGTFLLYRVRSRRTVFLLMVGSLVYFGFFRKGCICAVGSLQNMALSLFDADYALPVTALAFFILPLIFTLLFGRIFCGVACPLGAIQDAVVLRPLRLPRALSVSLSMLPVV